MFKRKRGHPTETSTCTRVTKYIPALAIRGAKYPPAKREKDRDAPAVVLVSVEVTTFFRG